MTCLEKELFAETVLLFSAITVKLLVRQLYQSTKELPLTLRLVFLINSMTLKVVKCCVENFSFFSVELVGYVMHS